MGDRNFVYLLGIIKWINLMTAFVILSNILASFYVPAPIAIVIQLLFVGLTAYKINKWFEAKYGKKNLIESTLVFKIINISIIILIAIYLFQKGQYLFLSLIIVYMLLFSISMIFVGKSKQKKVEGKGNHYA